MNHEKLVKLTLKVIAKSFEVEYDELKLNAKKVIKMAQTQDEKTLGIMEELMDLSEIGSKEELNDYDLETLKIYCRIKEIDYSKLSEKGLRAAVWDNMESEYSESDSDSDSDDSEDSEDSESESEDDIEGRVEELPSEAEDSEPVKIKVKL
jgi:hypothetical protein